MNKITMDKKYKTRDGRKVRVLCVDKAGEYPVVALVYTGAEELLHTLHEDGRFSSTPECVDLIEIKTMKIKVALFYHEPSGSYSTRVLENADFYTMKRILENPNFVKWVVDQEIEL